MHVDTTRGPVEDIELFVHPCKVFHDELWIYERKGPEPAAGVAIAIAGRVVATTDARGRVEACAQEQDDLQIQEVGFVRSGWFPYPLLGHRMLVPEYVSTGRVLNAGGSPAMHVGVQPLWFAPTDVAECQAGAVVATTDNDGRFTVAGQFSVCGLRIFRSLKTYEVSNPEIHEVRIESPLVLEFERLRGGDREMIARLPPRSAATGVLARPPTEPWIRGHVVAGGAPVADARVGLQWISNSYGATAYTRRDGSFALFVEPTWIDDVRWHVIDAELSELRLAGRVSFGNDHSRDDLTIEIGSGLVVNGTVVDTHGRPMVGVRIGFDTDISCQSELTGPDGTYTLVLPRPGRYRLGVFDDRGRELSPPPGRIPPTVDVAHPYGERTGLRITVLRDLQAKSLGSYRVGAPYVDLGVMLDEHQRVVRIADEAAAAGMRVGDRVLSVGDDHDGGDDARFGAEFCVQPGTDLAWTAMRAGKVLSFHAHAPWLGAPGSSR